MPKVWDMRKGMLIHHFARRDTTITTIFMDATKIVAGCDNSEILIHDLEHLGGPIQHASVVITNHSDIVSDLAVEDRCLLSSSWDKTLSLRYC